MANKVASRRLKVIAQLMWVLKIFFQMQICLARLHLIIFGFSHGSQKPTRLSSHFSNFRSPLFFGYRTNELVNSAHDCKYLNGGFTALDVIFENKLIWFLEAFENCYQNSKNIQHPLKSIKFTLFRVPRH